MIAAIAAFSILGYQSSAKLLTAVKTFEGVKVSLTGHRATVLVFLTPECPIARSVQPEIARLVQAYQAKDVQFLGIHIDPTLDKNALKTFVSEYSIKYPQTIDGSHLLIKQYKATVTPEAFVLDSKGGIQYQGQVDDAYKEVGVKRTAKKFYLREAIQAVLNNKKPDPAQVKAVGCIIPELKDFGG